MRRAHNIRYHLAYIGWLVRARDWLAGDRLTTPISPPPAHLSAADYLGDVPWSEDEAAKNWYARVKSRPSFRPILAETWPGFRRPRTTPTWTFERHCGDHARADRAKRVELGFAALAVARPDSIPQAKSGWSSSSPKARTATWTGWKRRGAAIRA